MIKTFEQIFKCFRENEVNMKDKKHIDLEKIEEVKGKIPSEDDMYELAELFKVFGDSTRTRILTCLEYSELCVCEISEVLNMSISAVSHQLRVLRQSKLVKARKIGKEVYYSLDDDHVLQIISFGFEHLNERK